MGTSQEEILLSGRSGRVAYLRALEALIKERRVVWWSALQDPKSWNPSPSEGVMWNFSYVGRGCADQGGSEVEGKINAAADQQIALTPERAKPYIRAAEHFVRALAAQTNRQLSVVAEGWIDEQGAASVTVQYSCAGVVPAAPPEPAEA